jgi:phospholipid/cholesterol/gamma-HCH transport system ATP-binding protein
MKTQTENLVEMTGVTLKFDGKSVLNSVNVSLLPEEVLVIMGLSGGGKSTLLSILIGLLKPDAGSVCFKQEDLTTVSRAQLNIARTHMGMVYQNAALISSMNVGENIAFPLKELSRKSDEEIDGIVDRKLELVGLQDVRDKLPSELSGGMQKRVGLARALVMEPELVLFDEPTAGLDPINGKLIDDLIVRLREQYNVTAIVVTHEMDSAFAVATRMAFLHEGKILLDGSPDEFQQSDQPIIQQFLSAYTHSKDSVPEHKPVRNQVI